MGQILSCSGNAMSLDTRHQGTWIANQWAGYWIRILTGNGSPTDNSGTYSLGQTKQIVSSTADPGPTVTISQTFDATNSTGTALNPPRAGDYYMIYRPTGIGPQLMPGAVAFGRLNSAFTSGGAPVAANLGSSTVPSDPTDLTQPNVQLGLSFTSVNVIFSPSGTIVTSVPKPSSSDMTYWADPNGYGLPVFATQIPGYASQPANHTVTGTSISTPTANLLGYFCENSNYTDMKVKLWSPDVLAIASNLPSGSSGVQQVGGGGTLVLTVVNWSKFSVYNGTARATYISDPNNGCPYLSLNVYTGQMLPRK